MEKKICEHEAGEILFGKILEINSEMVKVEWRERCQSCGLIIDRGRYIYTRKD